MSGAQHTQRAIQHPFIRRPLPPQSSFCQGSVYPEILTGASEDQRKVGSLMSSSPTSTETVSPRSSGWSQFSSLTGSGDSGQFSVRKASSAPSKFPSVNYGPTGMHSIYSTGLGGRQCWIVARVKSCSQLFTKCMQSIVLIALHGSIRLQGTTQCTSNSLDLEVQQIIRLHVAGRQVGQ